MAQARNHEMVGGGRPRARRIRDGQERVRAAVVWLSPLRADSAAMPSTSKPRAVAVAIPVSFDPANCSPSTPSDRSGTGPEVTEASTSSLRFLVVSSRRHTGKWVFPKASDAEHPNLTIFKTDTFDRAALRKESLQTKRHLGNALKKPGSGSKPSSS